MSDLLFEIGTEEIPAGYIRPALQQLAQRLGELLEDRRLAPQSVGVAGTPRRLVVWALGVPQRQPSVTREVVGPPAGVAFNEDGTPGKAAEGFARSQGVPVESLSVKQTDKGPYVTAQVGDEGAPALEVLPDVLREAALSITFPKSMRWPGPGGEGDGPVRYARPIRRIVALLDGEVAQVQIAGIAAGRATCGHPFLSPGDFELADASYEAYRAALRERGVLVDMDERREAVRAQVSALLDEHGSGPADSDLLDEVTNLVEQPHALEGEFDEQFLAVPDCVVVAAMTEHQRYFPVRDAGGKLLNRFIVVSNRGPAQERTVREGNERVLRARLADGKFFWDEDRRRPLSEHVPRLGGVVFLGGLGDNLQRTERLVDLSGRIAEMMGLAQEQTAHARRAAHLCKADLLTGLVGEFPSLQGKVGRELALQEGEPSAVADAIAEHYRPAGADDDLPSTPEGAALALADKLDVICGCFALGHLPSGSQDPFALRRNALGVLRILAEERAAPALSNLVEAARDVLEAQAGQLSDKALRVPVEQVLEFFRDRLYHASVDRGFAHDAVLATLSVGFDHATPQEGLNHNVRRFWQRLEALAECAGRPWWPALVELVDRTYRIQRDLDGPCEVRQELLAQDEERDLAARLAEQKDAVAALFGEGRLVEAAELYAEALAGPVHEFFEQVFVNVDDEAVRRNRKSLCGEIYHLFADSFADLYVIESAEG